MPRARVTIQAPTSRVNPPSAMPPPQAVLRQETNGLALMAIRVTVPCMVADPPGVIEAIVCATRDWWWTSAVNRMTGSPRAITISEPGNTQLGRPMTMMAARLRIAMKTNAPAYKASALPSERRVAWAITGLASWPPLETAVSSSARISPADCGRCAASFSRQRMTRFASVRGVSGRRSRIGTGFWAMWATNCFCGGRPWNGVSPQSSSYAMQPKA